jgi:DNA-binding NtrC family response regulator
MTVQASVVDDRPNVEARLHQELNLPPRVKERRPGLPVVLIAEDRDADAAAIGLARGADKFLTKPVNFQKLKQEVVAVIVDTTGNR